MEMVNRENGNVLAIGCFDVGKISELSINVISDSVALVFSYDENGMEHMLERSQILKPRGMFAQISRSADIATWGMNRNGDVIGVRLDEEEQKRLLCAVVRFYGRIHAPFTREMHKYMKKEKRG